MACQSPMAVDNYSLADAIRFRWVQCQLDLLSRLRTPGQIRQALASLPPTLDQVYEQILDQIDYGDKLLARDILELLCFALGPLTLDAIRDYLQIDPGSSKLDGSRKLADPKDVSVTFLMSGAWLLTLIQILGICGSLLSYRPETETVTLAHHSVKTCLVFDVCGKAHYFRMNEKESQGCVALKCIHYLSMDEFATGPCSDLSALQERFKRHPFLEYAARCWAIHAQKLDSLDEGLWASIKAFLFSADVGRGNYTSWIQMLIPESKNISKTSPLYYAASFGLTHVVRYLLEAGASTEEPGGRFGATPITIAAFRGHEDVVKLLFRHGANPAAIDIGSGWSAIQWARHRDMFEALEMFAAAGLEIPPPTPTEVVAKRDLGDIPRWTQWSPLTRVSRPRKLEARERTEPKPDVKEKIKDP
jgi:hypothetical protein